MSHSTQQHLDKLHVDFGFKTESHRLGTSYKAIIGRQFHQFLSSTVEAIESVPPFSEEDREYFGSLIDDAPCRKSMLESLRSVLGDELFFPIVMQHVRSIEGEECFLNFQGQFSQRIRKLRSLPWLDQFPTQEEKDAMVLADVMRFGVSNIILNAFSFLEIIPHVFQNHYGRLPTEKEYEAIAGSIEPLILCLASTHDEIFTILFSVLRTFTDEDRKKSDHFPWPAFNASDYVLEDSTLEISSETIARTGRWLQQLWATGALNSEEVRIGCPAKFLIPIIYRRCHNLALQIFTPRFERIVTLPAK